MPYKIGLIKTLVDRACKINSSNVILKNDLTFIQNMLQKNMYPQNILSHFIQKNLTIREPLSSTIIDTAPNVVNNNEPISLSVVLRYQLMMNRQRDIINCHI